MNFSWFLPQFSYKGRPVSGGTLTFFVAGSTTIPKNVWYDAANTIVAPHVIELDSYGTCPEIYPEAGQYLIEVRDQFGGLLYTRDHVEGSGNSEIAGDHKVSNEASDIPGYLKDKLRDSDTVKWSEIIEDGYSVVKADVIDLDKVPAVVVWAILDDSAPATAPFGLSNDDINTMIETGFGVAAQTQQGAFPSQLTIWYVTGTSWEDAVWEAKAFITGSCITNLNHGEYNYLQEHTEYHPVTSASNYPPGIYVASHVGDGRYWEPLVVQQYPEPDFNISSFLQYDATSKAFVWVSVESIIGKVKVSSDDGTAEYLADKIVSDHPKYIAVENMDIGDPAHTHKLILRVKGANPLGPAGGDLFGSYPDPIVRQLTGVGANLAVANDDSFIIDQGGRCIAAGKAFYGATKVERKCWSMITSKARVYRSFDYWKTYKVNMSLLDKPDILLNEGTQLLGFVYGIIPGTTRYNWMWIAGDCNYHWYASEHIPENYDNDGNSINWSDAQSFGTYTSYRTPCHVTEYKGVYFLNDSFDYKNYLITTKDWQTFEAIKINNTGEEITAPGNDGYGNLKLIERDTGIVHKCTYDANNANWYKTWTTETAITLNDSATTVSHFPEPSAGDIWYSSIQSMYGTWVIAVAKDDSSNSSKPSYWYSEDGSNWYSVVESTFPHFWEANNDGVRWFASNFVTRGEPIVYQLLINQIPAHRQLVAEKGIIVDGGAFLTDLPNAPSLGTDENGKIIAVSGSSGNFIRNQDSNGTNDAPGNIFLDPSATINIRYEDTGTPANNVNWFSVSKDMLKLQGLDVNNPALIGYQAELTPSALALRGRPGTSYGIYNAAVIMNREQFNWVPNATGTWYSFNYQDLGGGTAEAKGGYRFPRLKFRIGSTDTVSAELEHKIVDSNGNELSKATNGTHGQALVIPTTQIAGTPNAQELWPFASAEGDPHTIAQDGTDSGNCSGNRGFAFIATSSRTITKMKMFFTQSAGNYRMGIYDSSGTLLAKTANIPVAVGTVWVNLLNPVTLVGGNVYYMAYYLSDTTGNVRFYCVGGRSTYNAGQLLQIYDTNNEMPTNLGTSGSKTEYRPWILISE